MCLESLAELDINLGADILNSCAALFEDFPNLKHFSCDRESESFLLTRRISCSNLPVDFRPSLNLFSLIL